MNVTLIYTKKSKLKLSGYKQIGTKLNQYSGVQEMLIADLKTCYN